MAGHRQVGHSKPGANSGRDHDARTAAFRDHRISNHDLGGVLRIQAELLGLTPDRRRVGKPQVALGQRY